MNKPPAVHFACTQCGKCCHDLRLTLSLDEAITWAGNGHQVQLLCEAIPWPRDPLPGEYELANRRDASFAVEIGGMPFRIHVTLVAFHEGACPHLQPDMRCGNYAHRPRICRIYPLESRPFTPLDPASRRCPDEAWAIDAPVLLKDGVIADPTAQAIVNAHRQTRRRDAAALGAVCFQLGISAAAFAGEGLAVHAPDPNALANCLRQARASFAGAPGTSQWEIVTNRQATLELLHQSQCPARLATSPAEFLGSFEPDL
ncbi:MAG: YkgJ family cysteine cluster protein [Sphingomonas sp.]|jgi:Fe-S-cluster containining protein|uniref:YkgJ family cysteine cluster protein n=1 Tax=Sphingomonas sp. TaxID=28214 RepID=UPI0035617C33